MVRLEIIANRSVEDIIMEQLSLLNCQHFTKIPLVYGAGNKEPKQGDSIWPEANFILIIYGEKEELTKIILAINSIKEQFKHEGIQMFQSSAEMI